MERGRRRGREVVAGWVADLRYGARSARRSWRFTLGIALLIALGSGAAAGVFGILDAEILSPLPFSRPDRLVMIWTGFTDQGLSHLSVSPPEFRDIRMTGGSLERVAGFVSGNMNLISGDEPLRVRATWVTDGLFETLGVTPEIGGTFVPADQQSGETRRVILSDSLWRSRFAADRSILGKNISLNERPYVVAGVMGPEFKAIHEADVWVPLRLTEDDFSDAERGDHYLRVVGRMAPDVDPRIVQGEMNLLADRLERRYPEMNRNHRFEVVALGDEVLGAIRPRLLLTFAAVGVLLLLVCLTATNLMTSRTLQRRRELSVRMALGASRRRIAVSVLTEVLVIVVAGMAPGLFAGLRLARWFAGEGSVILPRAVTEVVSARTVAFGVVSLVVVVLSLFIGPALVVSRHRFGAFLGSRGSGNETPGRRRSAVVVVEVALATVILTGAGLTVRSYRHLTAVQPGWRMDHRTTMRVQLPSSRYGSAEQKVGFVDRLLEPLRSAAIVESVAVSDAVPFSGEGDDRSFFIEGSDPSFARREPTVMTRIVSEDFFRTLGIPILQGRAFQRSDDGALPVAVISRAMARRYWRDENAIGKRITFDDIGSDPRWLTIVGIAGDVRSMDLSVAPGLEIYVPFRQRPASSLFVSIASARGEEGAVVDVVRDELRRLDPTLPVFDVAAAGTLLRDSLATRRLTAALLGGFGLLALTLAVAGTFAVVSYQVSSRTREIGIRMVVGASTGTILVFILRKGLGPVLAGIPIGLAGALLMSRGLETLVFGISPLDPATYAGVAGALIAGGVVASLIPGVRASRIDPASNVRVDG